MARVVLQDLVKEYPHGRGGSVPAIRGLNLTIEDREFLVLVGPSGCGKSTTLRMIAGLEEISAGSIRIDGREIAHVAPKDRDIAMVFQNYALYPHLSVFENMAFGLRMRAVPKPEIDGRVREVATLLGLSEYLERRPRELSGGQRQRVALGRAIVRQPKVFLFDEPLSNLDAKMRVSTRTELVRLHRRLGATVIYVTHDQAEAMTMGTRICVMKDGRIMQVDTPLAIYNRPANLFVAGFIGSPPMNLWPGRLVAERGGLAFRSDGEGAVPAFSLDPRLLALGGAREGVRVTAGVRPEAVLLRRGPSYANDTFGAVVERVEAMGAETFVHLYAGGCALVARCGPEVDWQAGESVTVHCEPDCIHLFDTESGESLEYPAARPLSA